MKKLSIEEQITSILSSNTIEKATKIIAEIMRNIAKNDITMEDNPDNCVKYEIEHVIRGTK